MPIENSWYEPDLIYKGVYTGRIGREEFIEAIEEALTVLDNAKQRIHFMVDLREMQGFPIGQMPSIPQVMRMLNHPNMGWIALVGAHPAFAFWTKVFIKLVNLRQASFGSIEEAATFLREVHRIHVAPKQ